MIITRYTDDRFLLLAFYFGLFYFVRSRATFRPERFVKDVSLQFIIAILAVIASQNAGLSLSLNLIIVFMIAYVFLNQTSPGGYIIYLLEFVFLQLKLLKISDIPTMSLLLIGFYSSMFAIFYIKSSYTRTNNKNLIYLKRALPIISEHLESILMTISSHNKSEEDNDSESIISNLEFDSKDRRLVNLSKKKMKSDTDSKDLETRTAETISNLYKSLANAITFPSKFREENVYEYYMVVIIKRIASLRKSLESAPDLKNASQYEEYLKEVISDISSLETVISSDDPDKYEYARNIIDNIIERQFPENVIFGKSISEIFYLLDHILKDENDISTIYENHILTNFKLFKEFIKLFGYRFYYQMNEIRLAFALRISIITALTVTASLFIPIQYSYWLPINAVLLIKPQYEESQIYVKKRFIGTVLGSILLAVMLSQNEGKLFPYILCFIGSVFFYSSESISWTRSFASAIFGTSLAAISLGAGAAVELKILFIAIASITAVIANKFFLSKNKYSIFINNCKNIGIISLDNLDSSINNSNIENPETAQNHMDRLNTIYTFVQIYYTLKDIKVFTEDNNSDGPKSENKELYSKLVRFTESIQNMSFLLYTGIVFDRKDIRRIKKLIEVFSYRVQTDTRKATKTLDKIDMKIKAAFANAKRRTQITS